MKYDEMKEKALPNMVHLQKGRRKMWTPARKKASEKYDAANTIQIKLKLNVNTDADILDKLNKVGNKQGYIKGLIRADLKTEESEPDSEKL